MHKNSDSVDNNYKYSSVCKNDQSIIYAWAMDAPKLVLPESKYLKQEKWKVFESIIILALKLDVAFKIGPDTKVQYIVLQVHYANIEPFLSNVFFNLSFVEINGDFLFFSLRWWSWRLWSHSYCARWTVSFEIHFKRQHSVLWSNT